MSRKLDRQIWNWKGFKSKKVDQEIGNEIFKKPENNERAKMEAELLSMHHGNVIFLRSLNESQYDGKVIDGEEAVSKATIEPHKTHLRNSSIIAVRVKVNKTIRSL